MEDGNESQFQMKLLHLKITYISFAPQRSLRYRISLLLRDSFYAPLSGLHNQFHVKVPRNTIFYRGFFQERGLLGLHHTAL
jgi:hypothetical protein